MGRGRLAMGHSTGGIPRSNTSPQRTFIGFGVCMIRYTAGFSRLASMRTCWPLLMPWGAR